MSGFQIDTFPSILGGGIPGGQPKGGLTGIMEGGGDRGMFRVIMRNANGRYVDNRKKPADASVYTRTKQVISLTKNYNDSKF